MEASVLSIASRAPLVRLLTAGILIALYYVNAIFGIAALAMVFGFVLAQRKWTPEPRSVRPVKE
jgi:hypothetical protein